MYTKNQSEQTKIQYDIILINWGPSFRAGSEMLNVEGGKETTRTFSKKFEMLTQFPFDVIKVVCHQTFILKIISVSCLKHVVTINNMMLALIDF